MKNELKALAEMDCYVVKANELIQKSRFNLTVQQQKIVLYLISKISQFDDDFKLYEFGILDFCRIAGIENVSGRTYQEVKDAIKEIADKSLWIKLENGQETLLRWIEKPYIDEKNGTIRIKLDKDMKPYLLQLKANFTKYEMLWTMNFKSKYSIRLYELMKSVHYRPIKPFTCDYKLDELRKLLGAESYTKYQDFKRILERAVDEINTSSDIVLHYEPIKKSRSVYRIQITVKSKEQLEVLKARSDIERRFGLDQMSLWASGKEWTTPK